VDVWVGAVRYPLSAIRYPLSAVQRPLSAGLVWSGRLGSGAINRDAAHQSGKHSLHVIELLLELGNHSVVEVLELVAEQYLVLELGGRSERNLQEPPKLRVAATSAPLGHIHGDRERGSAHLRDQPVLLCGR
jgi:hypothetical protein